MTTTKKANNYQKFTDLPNHLKVEAMKKATRIGYTKKEAEGLYYNNDGKTLVDGVIDKRFRFW